MATVFKRSADRRKKGSPWYMRFKDADGRWRTKVGCSDKDASQRMADKLEADAHLRRAGVIDPKSDGYARAERRPLNEHLRDFHDHLIAKGDTPKHAQLSFDRANRVVALIRGGRLSEIDLPKSSTKAERDRASETLAGLLKTARLSDLTPSRVQDALATLRTNGRSHAT